MDSPVIIRTDANAEIGSGHFMRCIALAQECKKRGTPVFFVTGDDSEMSPGFLRPEEIRFLEPGIARGSLEDANNTITVAGSKSAKWIVVDGYHFNGAYQKAIKEAGYKLLFFDDYGHCKHYFADVILNQTIASGENLYANREPYTRLLLGNRYVLLRDDFLSNNRQNQDCTDNARKILVTMGGSDPHNTTIEVLQWLFALSLSDVVVDVVIGPSNQYVEDIKLFLRQVPFVYRIHQNANNMASLMAHADFAISSAGTTSWEMAFMGVPSLLIAVADNQHPIAETLQAVGASIYLGRNGEISSGVAQKEISRLIDSPELRKSMRRLGPEMIDGMGSARVADEIIKKGNIVLRRANEGDCRVIWDWSNDSVVRKASFSTESIPWETHIQWFRNKLNDANCEMYIAQNEDGEKLGQVRFEMDQHDAIISVSLDPSCRNKGYGREIIAIGTRTILERRNIRQVRAMVKKENIASLRAFENASFKRKETGSFSGEQSFCLVYRNQSGEEACT